MSSSSDYDIRAESLKKRIKLDNLKIKELKLLIWIIQTETVASALNNVDEIQTLPVPNIADISSNLMIEAKKNGVKYIVNYH